MNSSPFQEFAEVTATSSEESKQTGHWEHRCRFYFDAVYSRAPDARKRESNNTQDVILFSLHPVPFEVHVLSALMTFVQPSLLCQRSAPSAGAE